MIRTLILTTALVLGLAAADTPAADGKAAAKPYPLDTCIVSGEKLGEMGEPVVKVVDGQEVKFCCGGCVKKFDKEPAKYIKAMEEKATAGKADPAKPAAGGHEH